jgi:hypothetical protein
MKKIEQSPAYALQITDLWRVVVPVRGKLTPLLCSEEFSSQACAEEWLRSEAGAYAVAAIRAERVVRRSSSHASQTIAAVGQP